jgi:polyhydroxyalkanoate synthesis repressor PhaR
MAVIKRYPNRKLYDTEARQYITLEGIAGLIRQGHEVQVVDHATGEDLTAVVLTQIIAEQEKKRTGFLPQAVLTGLVRSGGETLATLQRTLASSLELLHQADEEIEERIQVLITRGELAEEEGHRLREKLLAPGRWPWSLPAPSNGDLAQRLSDQDLARRLREQGVPTHDDLVQIVAQLEALSEKLDGLNRP